MKRFIFAFLLIAPHFSYADDANKVVGACLDHTFYVQKNGRAEMKVRSGHRFNIKNDTLEQQHFTATLKICLDTQECNVKEFKDIHQNPNGFFVSPLYQLYLNAHYQTPGVYYFTAATDISGYKSLHSEQTCKIIVKRG